MKRQRLRGVRQSFTYADETPELSASGIHTLGLARIFGVPRKRPVDTARHRILQLTVAGRGEGLVNGRWVPLPVGTAYIVPPGAEWTWRYDAKHKKPWEHLFVDFRPDIPFGASVRADGAYTIRGCNTTDLLWTYQQLYRESLAKGRPTIIRCLTEIIACLAREILDEDVHHYRLSDLWMIVANDLSNPWDLAALCRKAAMSQEKLRLLSQKETQRSPMAQVAYLRMRHAAELLAQRDLSVQQIAPLVGYATAYALSAAFKRSCGLSPAHYRSKQRDRGALGSGLDQ